MVLGMYEGGVREKVGRLSGGWIIKYLSYGDCIFRMRSYCGN